MNRLFRILAPVLLLELQFFPLAALPATTATASDRVEALTALASSGNAEAQNNLGEMYLSGDGVRQDYEEAEKWLKKAAIQGIATAQFRMGELSLEGKGCERSEVTAAKWFRRAANQGFPLAQAMLGLMYANGAGVPQDYVQSHMWLNLSAATVPDDYRINFQALRDFLGARLTAEEMTEAQRMARGWQPLQEISESKHIESDWLLAMTTDSVKQYELFISEHTESEYADKARIRIKDLLANEDWRKARLVDTIEGYRAFLNKHPEGDLADEARMRLNGLKKDLSAWTKTTKTNTIKEYRAFIKTHPESPYREAAEARVIDLEVEKAWKEKNSGSLPAPVKSREYVERNYAIVNVFNDTPYNLSLRYSGKETFKITLFPKEHGSIELLTGKYNVLASVDSHRVRNYIGTNSIDGAAYTSAFYIISESSNSSKYRLPIDTEDHGGEFRQWPLKRKLPAHLKK